MDFSGRPGGVVEGDSGSAPTFEPMAKIRQEEGAGRQPLQRCPVGKQPKPSSPPQRVQQTIQLYECREIQTHIVADAQFRVLNEVGSRNLCSRRGTTLQCRV